MSLSPSQMDQIIQSHFGFEASDDVPGVLGSLAAEVEHEVVPSPVGELRDRAEIRAFYERLFEDLKGESVTPLRRLYGKDFVVDEAIWHGHIKNGRQFLCDGKSGPSSFRILHIFEFEGDKIRKEQVWCDLATIQRQLGCTVR